MQSTTTNPTRVTCPACNGERPATLHWTHYPCRVCDSIVETVSIADALNYHRGRFHAIVDNPDSTRSMIGEALHTYIANIYTTYRVNPDDYHDTPDTMDDIDRIALRNAWNTAWAFSAIYTDVDPHAVATDIDDCERADKDLNRELSTITITPNTQQRNRGNAANRTITITITARQAYHLQTVAEFMMDDDGEHHTTATFARALYTALTN